MYLRPFQKEVVTAIISKEVSDLNTFFNVKHAMEEGQSNNNINGNCCDRHTFKAKKGDVIKIPKDRDQAVERIKEFVSLWDKIEKAGLVKTIRKPLIDWDTKPVVLQRKSDNGKQIHEFDKEIHYIICPYLEKQIYPFLDLEEFKKKGHKTNEELEAEEVRKDRKWTRALALFAIGSTIAATVFTVVFQYFTNTTERKVHIQNPEDFRETIKVELVETEETKEDSLKIQKKNESKIKSDRVLEQEK